MFVGRKAELDTLHNQFASGKNPQYFSLWEKVCRKDSIDKRSPENVNDDAVIYHEFHRVPPEQNLAEFSKSIEETLNTITPFISVSTISKYSPNQQVQSSIKVKYLQVEQ